MIYLNACAKILGVSPDTLRKCRTMPEYAMHFRSGRCDEKQLKLLVKDIVKLEGELNGEDKEYWKTVKTKNDALMSELELEEMRKKYYLKEDVEKYLQAIAVSQKALLKSKLCSELPQQLLGLTVPEIAVKMSQVLDDVCKLMTSIKI